MVIAQKKANPNSNETLLEWNDVKFIAFKLTTQSYYIKLISSVNFLVPDI